MTSSKGALCAVALGVGVALAQPACAGIGERLREGLFSNRDEVPGPLLGRYVSEDGRSFTLDLTEGRPLLKFDDSPEVYVLSPSPAPRGDVIYKNDVGEPVLRATRVGGFTLFSEERPTGEAVSLEGSGAPLKLLPMGPQAVFERLAQASLRASRAAHRTMVFEAEASPASSALIADAATVASLAIVRLAQSADGRRLLQHFSRVRFEEGKRASAALADGILRIIVAPSQGRAGRPSSDRILRAAGAS